MGLAASQARFLGITLRKANCEFKSTELAQQRLELTNQMTDISQEYANALNATKLVWHNEAVCDSFGNPMDFGLSYNLLMTPSAANDFTPYMFSTRSGAIVLNSKYAEAAKAAGISMAGGMPSQAGRDKFIASLANAEFDGNGNIKKDASGKIVYKTGMTDNIITSATCDILTSSNADVAWHYSAGMGAVPKDKGASDITTLNNLKGDSSIGQRGVDWLQIQRGLLGREIDDAMTSYQYEEIMHAYNDSLAKAKLNYMNKTGKDSTTVTNMVSAAEAFASSVISSAPSVATVNGYTTDYESKSNTLKAKIETESDSAKKAKYQQELEELETEYCRKKIIGRFALLEQLIKGAASSNERIQYQRELENLKSGICSDIGLTGTNEDSALCSLYWAVYDKQKAAITNSTHSISWNTVNINDLFQTAGNSIADGTYTAGQTISKLTIVENDTINCNAAEIREMTISDLLSRDIVIMAKGGDSINSVSKAASYIMDYIAEVFGLNHVGTGLNIDTESQEALYMALAMVKKKFLNPNNAVKNGDSRSNTSMLDNSAYVNAVKFNRIGATNNGDYAGVSLSNMVSAFLTYFDNFLRGTESNYIVGKGTTDGKTIYVTDDDGYAYVTTTPDNVSNEEKVADFFNELYNNICKYGWRYDDMVQDSEYLESAVKDGRYSMMALNNDGYFYQERYNDVGYMEEVQDEDAIARAEASFASKKAEITYKEDTIDIKSKKLDAEITELNTEINSVQNMISKTIEKTFSLFSN